MYKYIYPFPEAKGWADSAGIMFAIINTIFNIPTAFAIERFVGEYRVKSPAKFIHYIRFYIWYQMLTGIILVTAFSWYTLYIMKSDNILTWSRWLMLILISREYPAMAGIFLSCIKGVQRFDLESWLNFINDTFIRPGFELGFVLWGGYVLGADPRIGQLLGIAIGYGIGTYIDDFFSMGLAMYQFQKALKPMGYTIVDCFIPYVDRDVMKDSIIFGLKAEWPAIIGSVTGTISFYWGFNEIPGYFTLTSLSKVADEMANLIKRGGGINIKATISEARNNNKIALTSYYIAMSWKFIFFFAFAIGSVIFSFMPLLVGTLFDAFGATEYALAGAFIIPNLIATILEEPSGLADNIILGSNRPMFLSTVNFIWTFIGIGNLYFWLYIVHVQEMGLTAIIWWIPLNGFLPSLINLLIKWVFIHKEIAPVKFNEFGWQTFIAPLLGSLIIFGVAELWTTFVFPPLVVGLGGTAFAKIAAGVITVLFAFIALLMFMFFPLYTALGGNDANTLAIFHEAVEISGPSRFLFHPIDKAMQFLGLKSPLHNRFKIPHEEALKEAIELMKEKHIKDEVVKILKANQTVV